MATKLTWLGHASWLIETETHTILLDPFLNDNPKASAKPADLKPDVILVSHGHFDHVADVAEIANANDCTVVANYEIATWFSEKHNVKNTIGMNIGGGMEMDFGRVKMTHAIHSSQLPDGAYGGNPGGFLISPGNKKELGENQARKRIYFACDTALFSDMELIGKVGVDVAVVPIGDLFTMGPEDSVQAIKLIGPRLVLPTHYDTWPPIEQNAAEWSDMVKSKTDAQPVVLKPGDTYEI